MPRHARRRSESGIYHVMLRGINRQVIFLDDEDCEKYLQCLGICKELSQFALLAYCLMGNHVHLLIQEGKEPLELVFKRLGCRYVYWYNWKYKRTGHLFQDRFKSEPVDNDPQLLAVLRYIYQNPVKAAICEKLEDYPWSSYHAASPYVKLIDGDKLAELLPPEDLAAFMAQPGTELFLDIDSEGRLNDREAAEVIKGLCKLEAPMKFAELDEIEQRELLPRLREGRCSIRQIARLTGVSKAQVERLLK